MTMQRKKHRRKYIVADFFMSALAIGVFYFYRRYFVDVLAVDKVPSPFTELKFYMELVVIPLYWLFVFYISGYYEHMFHKSRISEFFQTFLSVISGAIILFFTIILNDVVGSYMSYYKIFLMLIIIQFVCVYTVRLYITHRYHLDLYRGKKGFRTLIVGDVPEGVLEASNLPPHMGNQFLGVVSGDPRIKGQIVNGYSEVPDRRGRART
jgi:FlaA1/EpsC-like NDP-sugar epimerase